MFVVNDFLDAVLLGCFFFGLIFSGMSLFLGIAHLGFGGDGPGHHDASGHGADEHMSPVSVGSILAFLTWFGGIAYLIRNGADGPAILSLGLGITAGLIGGYAVYSILKRVRSAEAGLLRPGDYSMPGTVARVTSSIRLDGTGEIVYEQRGVRQVSAARSATNIPIARGTEVVVHRLEAGIAIVEPWNSFVGGEFDERLEASERAVASRKLQAPSPTVTEKVE